MDGNILEAVVLLRIARDKVEQEIHLFGAKSSDGLRLLNDAADDIGSILVTLETEYGV